MLKICICDDNPAILEDLERIVAEWIHRKGLMAVVKGVGTGGACFNECGDWDIFLLDIGIPDISGIDLARKIRTLRHDAIIIFITAYGHFMADAFAVHAFGYISKPFAREQIDTVLDDCPGVCGPSAQPALCAPPLRVWKRDGGDGGYPVFRAEQPENHRRHGGPSGGGQGQD